MSSFPSVPEARASDMSTASPSSETRRTQRILACILCQQRKVKCDRQFPCANCTKTRSQCVPGMLVPRQRRRRFPERTLLDRLRKYEDLLRQHSIPFEPLHSTRTEDSSRAHNREGPHDEQMSTVGPDASSSSTTSNVDRSHEAKSVYHAMSRGFRDPDDDSDSSQDDLRETEIKRAWDQEVENGQHLLFGARGGTIDSSPLHPDAVQIFRLWQIYVDNVNPLLKVTHIPSLQARVIEAASDVTNIDANLEALMFSIYCTALLSLTVDDCQTMFGYPKQSLLSRYQFGCQQALWNCGFLRTSDRDCLTALFLYLISISPDTVPQSLSSIIGIAIRIAQRMGIDSESALAKCTIFEAEMRRRLWWPLMLFDTRVTALANSKTLTLDPTWDCKIPLNVNDTDLRPEMKVLPAARGEPTDAVFAVVWAELGDFIRHTTFHLDFANSALKPLAKHSHNNANPDGGLLEKLEAMIEHRYLKPCDHENPLHFMTIWTTRARLEQYRLLEHILRLSSSSARRVEAHHDAATNAALRLLECDTKVMASPMTKRFVWLSHMYFPFPAYYQISQDLKRRPTSMHAHHAWEVMSDDWEAWFDSHVAGESAVFQLMTKFILQAWDSYEAASKSPEQTLKTPRIVSSIKHTLAHTVEIAQNAATAEADTTTNMELNDFSGSMSMSTSIPAAFPDFGLPYGTGMQAGYAWMHPQLSTDSGAPGPDPMDGHIHQTDWTGFGGWPAW